MEINSPFGKSCKNGSLSSYRELNKTVKKLVRQDLKNYESNLANKSKTNPKMIFKYINSKTTIKDNIRVLRSAKDIITDPKEICETFSEWFHSVFHKNEDDNIPIIPTYVPSIQQIKFDIEKRLSVFNSNY